MITDLTKGNPNRTLWRFILPMLISVMFQQMYNVADSVIAGRFISENAVSAIGASHPVVMLFMQVANGLNSGCAVVISQFFGAKKYIRMKTAVSTSIIGVSAISLILTAAGVALCGPILNGLNTPDNIFGDAKIYLNVYLGGLFFLFLYNVCNGIFTALGDSKTPLFFLIGSSVGNILLDIVAVAVFDMGIAGIAWATFAAQGASGVLAAITLLTRLHKIKLSHKYPKYSPSMAKKISKIAIPAILQSSFISVGNLFIQGLINALGEAVMAGYSIGMRVSVFAVASLNCVSNGVSSFTAQTIGASKTYRVPSIFKAGMKLVLLGTIPFFAAYFFFPGFFVNLFVEIPSAEALYAGTSVLRAFCPFYAILAFKIVADGVLRGAGAMRPFMIATFADLVLRVGLAFLLVPSMGILGICIAWPAGWVIGAVLAYIFYHKKVWKTVHM